MITFTRAAEFNALVSSTNVSYVVVFAVVLALYPLARLLWHRYSDSLATWIPMLLIFFTGLISIPAAVLMSAADIIRTRVTLSDRLLWRWLLPIAVIHRVLIAATQPLWYDETFSAAMAAVPLENLPTALTGDVHPPLVYLVNWITIRLFGNSEFVLRLPSLVAGIVLIWLAYKLAETMAGRAAARITAALVMFLPALIYYSTDARYPMILACVVIGAALALLHDKPRWFAVLAASLGWLHATGFLYLAVLLLLAVRRGWIVPAAFASFVSCLWLPIALQQSAIVAADNFWLQLIAPIWHIVTMTFSEDAPGATGVIVVAVAFSATIASIIHVRKRIPHIYHEWLYYGLVIVVPIAAWLIGLYWNPVYLPRAMIASSVLIVIGWSSLIANSTAAVRRLAGRSILAVLALANIGFALSGDRSPNQMVFDQCSGADYVYVSSTNMAVIGQYYSPAPLRLWPPANNMAQDLSAAAKAALLIQSQHIGDLHGEICYILQFSPATLPDETQFTYATFGAACRRACGAITVIEENSFLTYYIFRWPQ